MHCPACQSTDTYQDGSLWICPACSHEWTEQSASASTSEPAARVWRDANGNILQEGDSVTVIKDLKVKGSSAVVKVGTKVRNIHLVDGDDGHDISCKIEGFGAMNLKTEFVRKA
jgi:protein PhnA